jgi:broad specificity phosphatase PhoE
MGLVLLVRHGQASFGADDYDVLSEAGVEQSRLLGRALAAQGVEPAALVHGDLSRQRDTAVAMVEGGGWSVTPEPDAGWTEFDHVGLVARAAAGRDLSDRRAFQQVFEEATARWSGGRHDAEYDEPWPAFLRRTREALDRAFAGEGTTVAITSGGPIAVLCARLVDPRGARARLWTSFNTVTVNTSVTRVIEGPTGRRLLSFNEHSHLPRELVTYR